MKPVITNLFFTAIFAILFANSIVANNEPVVHLSKAPTITWCSAAITTPVIDLGDPTDYCGLTFPITLDAGAGFDSYLWNTGETTQTIEVNDFGNYQVTGTTNCGTASDDITIVGFPDAPPIDFSGTFTDCNSIFPATLDAGPGFDTYLWSTGETTQTIEINSLETYSVAVGNVCNSGTYTYNLSAVITPPGITFPDDISLCNASFPILLDATGPFDDYLWNTGETTPSILVTGPGVYEVEISNSCGSGGDEIEFFSLGDAPVIDLGPDLEFCGSDFPITLDAGTGFDSYLWSTGETTQTISVSNGSNVSVSVSNSCGTSTDDITITNLGSGPNINLGSDQNIFEQFFPITLNAGNGGDSYLWNTGETTQTIEVDGPGTFSVEATNACGSGTDEVVVTINDPCEYNLTTYGLSVFNDGGTAATLSGVNTISVGGFTDYIGCSDSETLFDGSGFHNFWLEENASMEIDGASGFFSVYALNNNTIDIIDGSGGGHFYLGAGSTLTIFNNPPSYSYYLECGATLIIDTPQNFGGQIIAECPEQDIIDVQGSISIISNPDYLIECSDVNHDLTPAQIPGVILDIGGAIEINCTDFPYTLDASSVPGPYAWSTGETTAVIQVNSPGTYTCSVPSACGTAAGTAIISTPDSPTVDLGMDLALCNADFPVTLDAGSDADSYLWSTGETTQSIEINGPASITVETTNSCGTSTDDIEMTSLGGNPSVNLGPDLELCDTQLPYTLDAGAGFDSYLWSTGETSQSIEVNSFDPVNVEVTDVCGSAEDNIVISDADCSPCNLYWDGGSWGIFGDGGSMDVLSGTQDPFNIGGVGDFYVCSDSNITLEQSGFHDFWLGENAAIDVALASGGFHIYALNNNTVELTGPTSGDPIYYIGSGSTMTVSAVSNSNTIIYLECGAELIIDSPNFNGSVLAECPDEDITIIQDGISPNQVQCCEVSYLFPSGADIGEVLDLGGFIEESTITYPYTLDASSVPGPYLWSTGESTPTIQVNGPGTYTCSVPNSYCGTTLGTAIIGTYEEINLTPNLGLDMSVCSGDFPITLDAGPGIFHEWSTGEITQTIEVNTPGTYSVTVEIWCNAITDEIEITSIGTNPVIDLGADLALCNADFPVTLDAGSGFDSYLWSTGETSQTIVVNSPSSITVEVSSTCGTAADDLEITSLGDAPSVDLGADIQLCDADFPVTLDAGTGFDSYLWNNEGTAQTFTLSAPETMEVMVTNACGSDSDEIIVSSSGSTPIVDLGADLALCNADFPVTLDAGSGFESYLWSTGENSQTIEVNSPSSITVEVSSACGTAADDLEITSLGDVPSVDLGADIQLCDADFPVTLDAGAGFDSYLWNNGGTTQTFTLSTAETMEVTVTNACGSDSDEIIVSSSGSTPIVDLGADLTLCNADFPETLDAGFGFDSYLWSTGETSQTIEVDSPSSVTVEVSSACGMAADDLEITSLGDAPSVDLGADIQLCDANFPVSLDAGAGFDSYLWSTGETSQTVSVAASSTMSVEVTNICGTDSDDLEIVSGTVQTQNLDYELCSGTDIEVYGVSYSTEGTFTSFIPNEGADGCGIDLTVNVSILPIDTNYIEISLSEGEEFLFEDLFYSEPGIYEISSVSSEGCTEITTLTILHLDEEVQVFIPNSFTPDGDGFNEVFKPSVFLGDDAEMLTYSFQIFNRWGLLVYESNDYLNTSWNGSLLGNGDYFLPDDVYTWVLSYNTSIIGKGDQLYGTVIMLR